jgi:hypothetical protein
MILPFEKERRLTFLVEVYLGQFRNGTNMHYKVIVNPAAGRGKAGGFDSRLRCCTAFI